MSPQDSAIRGLRKCPCRGHSGQSRAQAAQLKQRPGLVPQAVRANSRGLAGSAFLPMLEAVPGWRQRGLCPSSDGIFSQTLRGKTKAGTEWRLASAWTALPRGLAPAMSLTFYMPRGRLGNLPEHPPFPPGSQGRDRRAQPRQCSLGESRPLHPEILSDKQGLNGFPAAVT